LDTLYDKQGQNCERRLDGSTKNRSPSPALMTNFPRPLQETGIAAWQWRTAGCGKVRL